MPSVGFLLLLLSVVVSALLFGGVHHLSRAGLHLLLAVGLGVVAVRPRSSVPMAFVAAGGALGAAQALGLLPSMSWGGEWRWRHSIDAEATVDALTHTALFVGALILGGALLTRRHVERLRWGLVAGGLLLGCFAAAHIAMNTKWLFGVLPPRSPVARFYAPFVNPNHFAAAFLFVYPIGLRMVLGRGSSKRRAVGLVGVVVAVGANLWASAAGPMLVLGAQTVVVAALWWRPMALLALPLAPLGVMAVLHRATAFGSDSMSSLLGRWGAWEAAVRAWRRAPVRGWGAGTYAEAVSPYREDHDFMVWGHAHNDFIEWLVGNGLVGAALAIGAGVLLWRACRPLQRPGLFLAVAGVAAYAAVDFPYQLPFFCLTTACLLAALAVERQDGGVGWTTTAVAAGLAVTQLVGSGWQLRAHFADAAEEALRVDPTDAVAASTLSWAAPWRAAPAIAELRVALHSQPHDDAKRMAHELRGRFPHDARALRWACTGFLRLKALDDAVEACDAAVVQAPWDARLWSLRATARLAHPDFDGADAWRDAVHARVPGALAAGWSVLPLGLYWADAADGLSPSGAAHVGRFLLAKGEEEAAVVAYESAVLRDGQRLHRPYVDLLERAGRWDDLLAYLDGLRVDDGDAAWVVQRRAAALVALERWAEARDLWLRAAHLAGTGLGRACKAQARLTHPTDGLALWKKETLLGTAHGSRDLLDYAELLDEVGDRAGCSRVIMQNKLLAIKGLRDRARALQARCGVW